MKDISHDSRAADQRSHSNDFAGLSMESQRGASAGHSESIVNVLAILSDGKQTMRGPSGTGFFVENSADEVPECKIATSLHSVIPDSRAPLSSIEVTVDGGQKYKAHFSKIDRPHDLAILTLEGVENPAKTCKPMALSDSPSKPGEHVTRLTRNRWNEESSNEGTFQKSSNRQDIELVSLEGEDPNRDVMVFDLYNNRGVDLGGSPILNDNGKVIAIHGGGLDSKTSIAIPVEDLKEIIEKPDK